MNRRARIAVVAALVVAFVVAVVVAGSDDGDDDPATLPGSELLGPEPGEQVPAYLARAATSLPARDAGPVWALVQFDRYETPAAAADLVAGGRAARVVFRVPLPRVQTALVTEDVAGQVPESEFATAQRRAADRRSGAAARTTGRAAAVARAEAARLSGGCGCVLAVLLYADRSALDAVGSRDGVRAVHAAAPRSRGQSLALVPLLPEQVDAVGPVPDDGPVG